MDNDLVAYESKIPSCKTPAHWHMNAAYNKKSAG